MHFLIDTLLPKYLSRVKPQVYKVLMDYVRKTATQLSRCFVTDWGRSGDQVGMEELRGVPEEGVSLPSKADLPTQGASLGREKQLVSGGEATAHCFRRQGNLTEDRKELDQTVCLVSTWI